MQPVIRVALLATVVDFGGIESVLLTLLRHMGPGVKLFPLLFTRRDKKANYFFESLDALNVPYDTIYVDTSRYKYVNPIRNISETIARFRKQRFDLIHSHGYRADLIGLVIAKYFSLPIVSTCHGFISIDQRLSLYNKLDIFLLRYFNRVIAVSERMKIDLVEKGIDDIQIQVITNAVSEQTRSDTAAIRREMRARMGIGNEEFVFGFVGRLSEEKGLAYLVEAMKQRSKRDDPWRLVLLGEGAHRSVLDQAIRDAGIEGKVFFAGFQNSTVAWYPMMDAFVLPSLSEGTPMALLEAMTNGLPIIATSVGGIPAILSCGENGILVPPTDPYALLDAMRSVAENKELRDRLSTGAIRSIRRHYSVGNWITKVAEVYTTTLQQTQ
ncbi:MAG: glycosyltransferase family 4 protein [Gammaproteobacteria bacterium]